ncbi:MAG: HEAT repeat domain-containing protein [Cyanobacteria bacterium P01_F01_bin.116]
MIWRSTLVFITSLTALTIPVESLRAESTSLLIAQSSTVDPSAVVNTNEATPRVGNGIPQQSITVEQQIEEVKTIQQELKERGYYNGPIDGIYGPNTAAAIRALRGQEGNQPLTPGLFSPTPDAVAGDAVAGDAAAAEDTTTAEAPTAVPQQTDIIDADNETESAAAPSPEISDGVKINLAGAAVETSSTEISESSGEQVSPETGDTLNNAASANPAVAAQSPGLGRLLWPGLALIAALGSFGIGFILSNRLTHGSDEQEESPWGAVPASVPQPELPQSNGYIAATNGSDSQAVVDQTSQMENGLALVSTDDTVSATTRLAKVDVIDELVANLQVTEPAKRRKAIWELGQRGNSSAVPHLVNSMVEADSKEKSLILAALSEIGIRSLKPMNRALAIALQDENPDVRKNAIRDLTRVYDLVTQISQMLGHATEDEDPEVRRTAEWALGQLNRIREAPQLKSSINTLEASRTPSELLPDEVENLKN